VFCRQTELVLRQNAGMVPPDFELAELQQDIATLDALRPRLQRLRTLTDRADDTELALGSDILSASLDGYALTKVIGQGTGLDTLKAAMKTRLPASRANPPIPPPERPPTAAPQGGRAVHVGGRPAGQAASDNKLFRQPTPFPGRASPDAATPYLGGEAIPARTVGLRCANPTYLPTAPPPVAAVLSPWPEARPTRSAADAPRRHPAVALGGSPTTPPNRLYRKRSRCPLCPAAPAGDPVERHRRGMPHAAKPSRAQK
jgi:hypothetical protein